MCGASVFAGLLGLGSAVFAEQVFRRRPAVKFVNCRASGSGDGA